MNSNRIFRLKNTKENLRVGVFTQYLPSFNQIRETKELVKEKNIPSFFIICNCMFNICLPPLDYKLHEGRDHICTPLYPQCIWSEGNSITPLLDDIEIQFPAHNYGISLSLFTSLM